MTIVTDAWPGVGESAVGEEWAASAKGTRWLSWPRRPSTGCETGRAWVGGPKTGRAERTGRKDAVEVELRGQVERVVRNIGIAETAGLPYEVFLHRRRLRELLDDAAAHGACVATWVDRAVLAPTEVVER